MTPNLFSFKDQFLQISRRGKEVSLRRVVVCVRGLIPSSGILTATNPSPKIRCANLETRGEWNAVTFFHTVHVSIIALYLWLVSKRFHVHHKNFPLLGESACLLLYVSFVILYLCCHKTVILQLLSEISGHSFSIWSNSTAETYDFSAYIVV